jgi:hypothetical protein
MISLLCIEARSEGIANVWPPLSNHKLYMFNVSCVVQSRISVRIHIGENSDLVREEAGNIMVSPYEVNSPLIFTDR